jgi:NADP-dependent alcohol dehydrogenase
VLPSLLSVRRNSKRAKLLQYAERVWQITEGSEDARIDLAIGRTRDFFESLGIKTRLSDYELGQGAVETVLGQLDKHGMTALGEHRDHTLAVSRTILEAAL